MLENKLYWDATWQAEGAMQISLPVASGANKITPLSPSTFLMKMKTIVSQDRLGTDIGKRTVFFLSGGRQLAEMALHSLTLDMITRQHTWVRTQRCVHCLH